MSIKNFLIGNAAKVANRPDLVKAFKNIVWLLADKFLRAGVGLLVGVWVARYLGPEQFGRLSYGISVIGLLAVFASFGSNSVVVQRLVRAKRAPGGVLGSGVFLQGIASILSLLVLFCIAHLLNQGDAETESVILVLGLTLLFKPADIMRAWFEANVESKYTVVVENGALLIASAIRVFLIVSKASLIWFAWSMFLEAVLVASGFVCIYRSVGGNFKSWIISKSEVINLARGSVPIMLSGIAISVYMRIDQVMLAEMVNETSVGVYAAALKISEIWYFLPVMIVGTVYPKLVETYDLDKVVYGQRFQKLLSGLVGVSIFLGIILSALSGGIVDLLYGSEYEMASEVLRVHVWTGVFVCLGVASSGWYINENLQKLLLYRTSAGALVNVALNLSLIPRYGALGAAWATLIAQFVSAYLFDVFNEKTRKLFVLKSSSFLMRGIF